MSADAHRVAAGLVVARVQDKSALGIDRASKLNGHARNACGLRHDPKLPQQVDK